MRGSEGSPILRPLAGAAYATPLWSWPSRTCVRATRALAAAAATIASVVERTVVPAIELATRRTRPPTRLAGASTSAFALPRVLEVVRTSSEVGVDEGGCSPTRARDRCACRLPRIKAESKHRRLLQPRQTRAVSLIGHGALRRVTRPIAQVTRGRSRSPLARHLLCRHREPQLTSSPRRPVVF